MSTFLVDSDDVEIPVTVEGMGPRALLVPGMGITQTGLGDLVAELRAFLSLATFDLRGHGATGPSSDYSYAGFARDTAAVTDALVADGPVVLIGFSLGGDLALDQAAVRRDTPALFLLDGGTPLAEPFLDEGELVEMRTYVAEHPPADYALTADEHVAGLREIDAHRRTATERFDALDCPVTMVMSTTIAGEDGERARHLNDLWRRSVDDLAATRPAIEVHRLPGGHDLPLVHPRAVARLVRAGLARSVG